MEIYPRTMETRVHGPPDHLIVDQVSNYVSKEMKRNLETARFELKEALV